MFFEWYDAEQDAYVLSEVPFYRGIIILLFGRKFARHVPKKNVHWEDKSYYYEYWKKRYKKQAD